MRNLGGVLPYLLLSLPALACGDGDISATAGSSFGGSTSGDPINNGGSSATSNSGTDSNSGDGSTSDSTTGVDPTTSGSGNTDESSGSSTGTETTGPIECDVGNDTPDINGLDEDNDGIDGVACAAVFVSAIAGSDLNEGLEQNDAVQSITRGIQIAETFSPPRMVLVSTGNYGETVNLVSGVSIYGGYDPLTWERSIEDNRASIVGSEDRTVIAQNLDAAVTMQGFTVEATSFQFDSASTYGIWVRDTPEGLLSIDACEVRAGDAGEGTAGDAGQEGDPGGNGMPGSLGTGGAGGTSSCGATGGNGGTAANNCTYTASQPGQNGGDGTQVGSAGSPGPDECSNDGCNDEGENAGDGGDGNTGLDGEGATASPSGLGAFNGAGLWGQTGGAAATEGLNGGGGGGGGHGGSDDDTDDILGVDLCGGEIDVGGGGGGAGAGGCGGDGGQSGLPGGGSFGIVVIASSISITNTDIFIGNGGNGGDGGAGGNAGSRGSGSGGGGGDEEAGNGGDGGIGGFGGAGGGGAGGCGGPSIGIANVSGSALNVSNVSFQDGAASTPGAAGTGGVHADSTQEAPAGEPGCVGVFSDQQDF